MKLSVPLLSLMLVFSVNTVHAMSQTAEEVVKVTADQMLDKLSAERANLEVHPEKIFDLIHEIVIPRFDFLSMSKWVLGKQAWRTANETQREEFIEQFRTLLVRTYAKALLEYSDENIIYHEAENNPGSNIAVVRTELQKAGSHPVPINYSMHVAGGEWKVVDVAVDGVSLVKTYRGSFASEIRKNGMDNLIEKLKQRNIELNTAIVSQ